MWSSDWLQLFVNDLADVAKLEQFYSLHINLYYQRMTVVLGKWRSPVTAGNLHAYTKLDVWSEDLNLLGLKALHCHWKYAFHQSLHPD